MKTKLLLLLTAITLTFQACSSDDEMNEPMIVACETPINLSVSQITDESAILNWESPNANLNVEVEYGLTGFPPGSGTVIMTSQNSTPITNLMSFTTYDFHVRAICAADNTSAQSSTTSFTTELTVCLTPINLSVSEITADSAILNWESLNTIQGVEVEYGPSGFSPGTGTIVSTLQNSTSIDGLIPSTSYDFYAQGVCAADNRSPQSGVTSFTTTEISPYAGTWNGTYDGDDTGTWTCVISVNGIIISGFSYSNGANATSQFASSTLTADGNSTVILENGTEIIGQFVGEIFNGTWASTNNSGNVTGNRE